MTLKFCTKKRTMPHRKYLAGKLPFLLETLVLLDLLFSFKSLYDLCFSSVFSWNFFCQVQVISIKNCIYELLIYDIFILFLDFSLPAILYIFIARNRS